jgi:UDP-N-acetylmuramoyl-L-alanyl-D-glutamate--2,6-diaminopimelate ligase
VASFRYGRPQKKLKVIAITGTDGKTTSATLVYQLLKNAGQKVALISTVAAFIGGEKIDTGFHVTSPHPWELYRLMRKMVKKKIKYLVLEVTSQGAYQYRAWGIHPLVAGVTNVDREHLDYHLTVENYLKAKALILNASQMAVINEDLPNFNQIKKVIRAGVEVVTYSKASRFSANLEKAVRGRFREDYNRLNGVLAITIVKKLGFSDKDLVAGIENFVYPQGRMELIANQLGSNLIVDFAHTPQALLAVLTNIRKNYLKQNKILVVIFGCAGLRDREKRPAMGKIGAKYADIAIFTAEDPRSENVWSIINQMKSDLEYDHGKVVSIANRRDALEFAFKHYAKAGNTIAVLGKGHEQSMNYDGIKETAWSDITAMENLAKKYATS